MDDDAPLTIGELARRSGLSLKALRLYDELGLLRPHTVDAVTGYRHYRPEQAERARRIGLLRRHLAAAGAEADDVDWTLHHGVASPDSEALVEVCVPFRGAVEPAGEVAVRVEPAHHEAWTRLTKAQVRPPDVMYAFDAVLAWVAGHGTSSDLDPREVYFADWVAVGADTPAVDVAVPYVPAVAR